MFVRTRKQALLARPTGSPKAPAAVAPAVQVQEWMMSLLWVRTVPEEHRHTLIPLFRFLRDELRYCQAVKKLDDGEGGAAGLVPPWGRQGDRFWDLYTSGAQDDARVRLAWPRAVPLLLRAPARLPRPRDCRYAKTALYLYPHGLALELTFHPSGAFSLEQVATRARELRYGRIKLEAGTAAPAHFASDLLARFGGDVWGPGAVLSDAAAEPFTVLTVLKATGAASNARVEPEGPVHRFLDKAAGWYDRDRAPEALESCRISSPRTDAHLLYGHRRSRCVWFPEHFETTDKRHSLRHYHRNLTAACMQTESLGQYLCRTADDLRDPGYLSLPQREYAWNVLDSVDRLAEGRPQNTYRSRSPARQMEQNGVPEQARRVREYLQQVS
jgi:hypothetical protein